MWSWKNEHFIILMKLYAKFRKGWLLRDPLTGRYAKQMEGGATPCQDVMVRMVPNEYHVYVDRFIKMVFLLLLAPCVVPHISHGYVADRASGSSVPHTHTIDVGCLSQFQKTHNSTPICKNGTWSRIPKCIPGKTKYILIRIPRAWF